MMSWKITDSILKHILRRMTALVVLLTLLFLCACGTRQESVESTHETTDDSVITVNAVGDIYLAKVKKLMPGLNAAFVNVGYEKDAFLRRFYTYRIGQRKVESRFHRLKISCVGVV